MPFFLRLRAAQVAILAFFFCTTAHAQWYGNVQLTSDSIERSVSQSGRKPSLSATLGLRSDTTGLYAQLGAATVSRTQYEGSSGYMLAPQVGWNHDANDLRLGLALAGQVFPGAKGPWFGSLPARLQQRAANLQTSDYTTVEARASLGWKIATLSVSHSLTNYLGLISQETGPLGTRLIESKGTTYVGLDLDWPLNDSLTLSAGVGRLSVPNFDELDYSDWRLSGSLRAASLTWVLAASGTSSQRWRNKSSSSGSAQINASVRWSF